MEKHVVTLPWLPIIITDIVGSFLTLVIAIWCANFSWQWQQRKTDAPFRHYILFLTLALACFAVSRSFGHLIKQFLLLGGMNHVWSHISPFSGAVNSATFVIVFTISLYFQRLRLVHEQLEFHQKNLENLVQKRTEELARANASLQQEIEDREIMEEEKERLASQLRQTQKMEAIGTLAGGIAHDFNNILTPIIGYTELTLQQLAPDSDMYHNLDQVRLSAQRAKDLVTQILTFSRKEEQKYGPVELCPLVKETLKLMRSIIPTTIDIEHQLDAETGYVHADPTQIHQMLVNLCTNAYQAMEEHGGILSIGLHVVHIEEDSNELGLPTGQCVKLSVSDTGEGMDEQTVERACEPFFTTKEFGKGTGLGLSIVHGIVASHGGKILIESKKGKGTTFIVYLPRVEKERLETGAVNVVLPPQTQYTGKERILLVDDETAIVEMQKASLEDMGYTVHGFSDSVTALEAFKNDPENFDLVITDQSMPKLPGSELASEIIQIRKNIPIILCTGYSSIISEVQAETLGIRKYLTKPITRKEMADAIREVMDLGRKEN